MSGASSGAFRCSAHSATLAEHLVGTASTVSAFLLLEAPGPWGADALRDSRLADTFSVELAGRCRAAGVRPLLIRRHGRSGPSRTRCFAAYASPRRPWLETATLTRPEDVLDLDLGHLGLGRSVGLDAHPEPIFLVCTHGRHDPCCAELGRPLAAALTAARPDQTWECSHIGGDRFAGNLMVLPDGLCYGRVDPSSGPRIAAEHLAGRLDLDHLRGRAGYGFATQAAEWHLRKRLDLFGVAQVELESQAIRGGITTVVFTLDTRQRWRVTVGATHAEPQQLTCRSDRLRRALQFQLVAVEPIGPVDGP